MDLNRRLARHAGFLIRLNLFALPFYAITATGIQSHALVELTQGLSVLLMQATGIPVTIGGSLMAVPVEGGTWAAYVSWDSSGWKSMLVFFALLMATDAPLKKRLCGLLLIPVLYAINLLRIWFMFFFVRAFGLEHYELVHGTLWSWGMVVALLAAWLLWKRWAETGLVNKLPGNPPAVHQAENRRFGRKHK